MSHKRLLLKLKTHGIGDGIIDWIEQWLTDKRQRVVVDEEVSNWKSVLSGVPQRSVLGPLLFLIYINDLDDNITCNELKFADDTKVFRNVNTDSGKQHLQTISQAGYTLMNIVGLSISQWFLVNLSSGPLAWMANLVKEV